jgi:O-antigen ligase
MVTALAVGALIWIPQVVFARLTFSADHDSRRVVYRAAFDHLPEYILTGVGAGNFWGAWGMQSGYHVNHGPGQDGVRGAHNAFIQVTINWGLAGLLALIAVVYLAYRCLPRGGGKDELVLCLYGMAVAIVLGMMVSHLLTVKEYSLGLGLLVGGHRWIWPKGISLVVRRRQIRRNPSLQHV